MPEAKILAKNAVHPGALLLKPLTLTLTLTLPILLTLILTYFETMPKPNFNN